MSVTEVVDYLSTIKAGGPKISELSPEEAVESVESGDNHSVVLSSELFIKGRRGSPTVGLVFQGHYLTNIRNKAALLKKIEVLL